MPSTVSVLIPTFNRAQFLPECLESILNQSLPPTQVIVINDGSTDNTRAVLTPYLNYIEYLEKGNGGKSSAINLGLTRVRGDYVWIMDDDDVALPDALQRHIAVLEQRPELGFTYSSHYFADTRPEDGRILPGPEKPMPVVSEEEFFLCKLEKAFFAQPAIVVRTACYRTVGPFNPELIRSEDYDMILRLARRFRCARITGPTYYRRKHPGARGTAAEPLLPEQLPQIRKAYRKTILRQLRQQLDLIEYLPKSFDDKNPPHLDKRRAYLQRMTIMASHGLFQDMLEDLSAAVAHSDPDRPFSAAERALFSRLAIYVGAHDAIFFQSGFLRQIRARCPGTEGRVLRRELCRAFASRAYVSLRRGALCEALRSARAAFTFGGPADWSALALRRFRRSRAS